MGLDWNPGNKPKPGHETEFEKLFRGLQAKTTWRRKAKQQRFFEISIDAFETLNAPSVGNSPAADKWALEMYRLEERDVSEQEWLASLDGFRVVDLVPPCDGIPMYTNGQAGGYVERYSFRAQFLVACEYIIGTELLDAGYTSMLPREFMEHGNQLLRKGEQFIAVRGLDPESLSSEDPESPEFHADVVLSAARWCLFWSERWHCLDAYW